MYKCTVCERTYVHHQPTCNECGSTMVPFTEVMLLGMKGANEGDTGDRTPYPTGFTDLDPILGGGLYPGNSVLLAAPPGTGKTVFTMKVAYNAATKGLSVTFLSFEMSPAQIKENQRRFGWSDAEIRFIHEGTLQDVLHEIRTNRPQLLVIDSVQMLDTGKDTASTWHDFKVISKALHRTAKRYNTAMLLISQVNRDGDVTGPNQLKHDCDVHLQLKRGESDEVIISAVKNRQCTNLALRCVLRKGPNGPEPKPEPETGYVPRHDIGFKVGVAAVPVLVKGEVILDELTVSKALGKNPKLAVCGITPAVTRFLEGILLDQFPTVRLELVVRALRSVTLDRGADLAIVMALLSTEFKVALPVDTCFFGTIDGHGKLVVVPEMAYRTERAKALGYRRIIGPRHIGTEVPTWTEAEDIAEVIRILGFPVKN